MKIKITADSTCDLPQHLVEAYNIHLAPLHIVLNEDSYADRVEITTEHMFAHMEDPKHTCHTAACNVAEYQQVFSQYQDYDAIIHVSMSSKLSSSYNNAVRAAEEFLNVHVVDSLNVSAGCALLVERAVRLASQGLPVADIVNNIKALVNKVENGVILNTLEYVKRGGRCSALVEAAATLLQMRVVVEIRNGLVEVTKKYRGTFAKCIKKFLDDRLQNLKDIDDEIVYFATAALEPALRAEARAIVEQLGYFKNIVDVEAGCVIACHSGPNAFALFFARK